jgi:RHS repeat-associated protein
MPGRKYDNGSGYRYGFNGKENDNEIKGEGDQQDYGMRIYDPRLGRFLSVDPLTKDYPWYTPYSFAGNKPIWATDLDGLEENTTSTYVKPPIILPPAKPKAENSFTQQSFSLKPTLQQGSDFLASVKARQNQQIALRQTVIAPKAQVPQNETAVSDYNPTEYQKRQSEEYARQAQVYKNLQGATMDPFAAQVTLSTYVTAQTYVNGIVEHGKGIVQGIQEGNYWSAAGNAALLALDASPFLLKGSTTAVTSNIPSRLVRIIPEEFAGSPTLGSSGAAEVFVADASAIKGITNSTDLAKRLTLLDANGNLIKGPFRVIEFDTPSSGLASPFNRTNPGFINGGKTVGGASEYVLPNLQVNGLKNVTQTTIK